MPCGRSVLQPRERMRDKQQCANRNQARYNRAWSQRATLAGSEAEEKNTHSRHESTESDPAEQRGKDWNWLIFHSRGRVWADWCRHTVHRVGR